jgi:hypothetical protein
VHNENLKYQIDSVVIDMMFAVCIAQVPVIAYSNGFLSFHEIRTHPFGRLVILKYIISDL